MFIETMEKNKYIYMQAAKYGFSTVYMGIIISRYQVALITLNPQPRHTPVFT